MRALLAAGSSVAGAGAGAGAPSRAPAALRQACMALRNIAARCPDVRPALAEKGAEGAVRAARAAWPSACGDAGSAALRDLGVDRYNE
jgi:hypothetical protein